MATCRAYWRAQADAAAALAVAVYEQRHTIKSTLGVECRRAFATVVIGHPSFVDLAEALVTETLRTYNSHATRIEVITYADLIAGARQAFALSGVNEGDGHE